jgi:endonuclease/exonuclease/phosphatase family metal-dependent hydrolase
MRILASLFLLVFSVNATAACIVTFNAYGPAYAPGKNWRAQHAAKELRDHNCDLVNLQEAWSEAQIDIFEHELASSYKVFDPNKKFRIGVMSFSKTGWADAQTYSFRVNYDGGFMDGFRRWVDVQKAFTVIKDAQPNTTLINTHLHPTSPAIRMMQLLDIFNWRFTADKGRALIMTGDFNADPGSVEHRLALALLDVADSVKSVNGSYPKGFCSYCESNRHSWLSGDHTFDYVLLSYPRPSRDGWKAKTAQLVLKGTQENPYSDHYGLKVDFENVAHDSVAEKLSKKEFLNLLKEVEADLLAFNTDDVPTYVSFVRRIQKEVTEDRGELADYFRETLE